MDQPTQYRIADADADAHPPLVLRRPVQAPAGAEQDAERMERYGISVETKVVYGYEGHVYDRLNDAVAYAKIQTARRAAGESTAPRSSR